MREPAENIDADEDEAIVVVLFWVFGFIIDEIALPPSIELRTRDLSIAFGRRSEHLSDGLSSHEFRSLLDCNVQTLSLCRVAKLCLARSAGGLPDGSELCQGVVLFLCTWAMQTFRPSVARESAT